MDGNAAQLQGQKLRATVKKVYENVPLRKAFDEKAYARGHPDGGRREVPVHAEVEPARQLPVRLFAVPQSEIVRVHASSTTGKTTVVGYTRAGHLQLGGSDGDVHVRGRYQGFRDTGGLRLRPVYRGLGAHYGAGVSAR